MSRVEEVKRLLGEALEHLEGSYGLGYCEQCITEALSLLDDLEDKKYLIAKDGTKMYVEHPLDLIAKGPGVKGLSNIYTDDYDYDEEVD